MAFNQQLADRIREALMTLPDVEEKYMFGGVCFMVNGKMCVGVIRDDMMCRIDPELAETVLQKPGCRPMDFTSRPMKGYFYVSEEGLRKQASFNDWMRLCLEFNVMAKPSKKKKPARK